MSGSVSLTKIVKAVADAVPSATSPVKLCVVGVAPELTRIVAALSAGADDERNGVSAGIDALTPADFPREARLAGRWDIVVFIAAGCDAEQVAAHVQAVRRAGRQVVGLVEPGVGADWAGEAGFSAGEIARGIGCGSPSLENRIVRGAHDGAVALAARLPALRRAYCDHVVLTNAAQNAAIGAVGDLEGVPKAYDENGKLLDKNGRVTDDPSKVLGYRLPTEAEWEYAAKGGASISLHRYSGGDEVGKVAWYYSNSFGKTQEVGKKTCNELGLFDMSGNVWEWCSDSYHDDFYSRSSGKNPYNNEDSSFRVSRGGGFSDSANYLRVESRFYYNTLAAAKDLGFRICRTVF